MKNAFPSLLLLALFWSCNSPTENKTKDDKYRPDYHFTPQNSWMNDPNGMVFHNGEYHLFYQYYPDSTVWGPMHWGHAVSTDLMNWEHLPIALYPDSLGYVFSGSCVVDHQNTSGFGTNENPPMVAIFTYHNQKWADNGRLDFQYQAIAYSLDNGRSWTKYDRNPVLKNNGNIDFRDPKVFWHQASNRWIMSLAVWDHISFFSSPNLKDWTHESDFGENYGSHAGIWECPDLIKLEVENSDEKKWALLVSINPGGPLGGSATQYFIGDFDGHQFRLDSSFAASHLSSPVLIPDGITFDDFENSLTKWTTTGKVFNSNPTEGAINFQNDLRNYEGEYLLNSFGEKESYKGTAKSEEFEITKPYINFRIGGGRYDSTYLALVINDQIARKSSANNGPKLQLKSWDVSEYIGQRASLLAVDSSTWVWGHITVDDITFADQPITPILEKPIWIDYGADNYAGVTWGNMPSEDGRTLFLGWMSNWQYAQVVPTESWRSTMTLPRELSITKIKDQYYIKSKPAREIEKYLDEQEITAKNGIYKLPDRSCMIRIDDLPVISEFTITFENDLGEKINYSISNDSIIFDRTQSGIIDFEEHFGARHAVSNYLESIEKIELFYDVTSLELFINDGEFVMTELVFPNSPFNQIILENSHAMVDAYHVKTDKN